MLNLFEVFHRRCLHDIFVVVGVMMTGMFASVVYHTLIPAGGTGISGARHRAACSSPGAGYGCLDTMSISGRLSRQGGPQWLVVSGLLVAFGSYGLARINPDMTREEVVMWMCIRAAGVGMAMMSIMTGGLASLHI